MNNDSFLSRWMRGARALFTPRATLVASVGHPPSARVQVDWTQAPEDAIEWVYDERGRRGRWLNGKHTVEEYGIVWEWAPAPDFGAVHAMRVKKTVADEALRQAAALNTQTMATTAPSRVSRL